MPNDPRPEGNTRHAGDFAARSANLAWQLERERLERPAPRQSAVNPVEALERRCERLEAALYGLSLRVEVVDATADLAAERVEVVESWR